MSNSNFWMVVGAGVPYFKHDTETAARLEAERLARITEANDSQSLNRSRLVLQRIFNGPTTIQIRDYPKTTHLIERFSFIMSPRNWTTCPQCKRNASQDHASDVKVWKASYGKVPPEEYEATRPPEKPPVVSENLREDYELWIDSDLKFHMHYHASCQDCGFEFNKTIDEPTSKEV